MKHCQYKHLLAVLWQICYTESVLPIPIGTKSAREMVATFFVCLSDRGCRNDVLCLWEVPTNILLCGSGRKEAAMRAIDDSSQKSAAVLRLLLVWKQLPESDVTRMLHDYFLITDDFREMEEQGLLTLSFYGDEYIISPTTLGRLWLEQFTKEGQNHGL